MEGAALPCYICKTIITSNQWSFYIPWCTWGVRGDSYPLTLCCNVTVTSYNEKRGNRMQLAALWQFFKKLSQCNRLVIGWNEIHVIIWYCSPVSLLLECQRMWINPKDMEWFSSIISINDHCLSSNTRTHTEQWIILDSTAIDHFCCTARAPSYQQAYSSQK